ncbi:MAG: glycine cleavage system aminomethyltransferase GcvT [Elusimicrobia bacterium]|nr:glycine cleavage system aminomethyltransferase GcvT [Elusimicrobiota bacterium]MDE2313020.1 glycine cleavage system aminomethyltransferase GcvT [Elusimicrobiota bacterium]
MPPAVSLLKRTALYSRHRSLGARLVDFHGWELPLQYEGILKEHEAVRTRAGIFDVSHMGQFEISGPGALGFLQKTNTNDVAKLSPGQALYSHLPNEKGGVVDDVIVSCLAPGRYFMVVNAATREKDLAWLSAKAAGLDARLNDRSDFYSMIALQGPAAAEIAEGDYPQAAALPRFGALETEVLGAPSLITRTGYTGEDGFEFIAPHDVAEKLWDRFLSRGAAPCGLGARDTLRLEAGLLLYGQDIDDEHTSVEAGYGWVVKPGKGDFLGRAVLERQLREGVSRRLRGVKLLEGGVPRPGCEVFLGDRAIGTFTSATYSPSLRAGLGTAYLVPPDLPAGTRVSVAVHGRRIPAEIAPTPFYRRQGAKNAKA